MTGKPRVAIRTKGPGNLAVGPFGPGDLRRESLLAWLRRRPDVLQAEGNRVPDYISIRYRDAGTPRGALIRALRDRLEVLRLEGLRPVPISNPRVEVVHAIRGLARLRVHGVPRTKMPSLARFVAALPGVVDATPGDLTYSIRVRYDEHATDLDSLMRAVEVSDPSSWPPVEDTSTTPSYGKEWREAAYNGALFCACITGALPAAVTGVGIAIAALPSARRTARALREGRLGVDLLDLAAVGISIGTGAHGTGSFITSLLSLGDVVLAHTASKARRAIHGLLDVGAHTVWRLERGEVRRVSLSQVRKGDHVVVETGGRVPVDGTIVRGLGVVDEKALTGESIPRRKGMGDAVLAASVVLEGELVLEVERAGADTTAARIVQILEGVGAKPVSLQRTIEERADWLVLPTCGVAGAAGALSGSLERLTSVLITDFGTGVRIAIPTSILATMTRAAQEGILIKGGHYLERLSRADTIVFDKTGTLTEGGAGIVSVTTLGALGEDEVLRLAAALETRQRHPVAKAIVKLARDRGHLEHDLASGVEDLTYSIGTGLSARVDGRTIIVGGERMLRHHDVSVRRAEPLVRAFVRSGVSPVFLAIDGRLEGVLGYADEPRRESYEVIRALRAGGRRKIVLLSGDAPGPVEAIARKLGIDQALANLLPEDKAEAVRELQRSGRSVAMVGDGINDAPALALADVGVSLGGAAAVAVETADVVLLSGGLAKLPRTFEIADLGMRLMRRGVGIVLGPNAFAMGFGALGLMPPALAAAINNGSTVIAALSGLMPLWSAPTLSGRAPSPSLRSREPNPRSGW